MKRKKPKLILMNGRWDERSRVFLCAYSKADAARMLDVLSKNGTESSWLYEINKYFNQGCWGKPMEGIEPERGAWVEKGYEIKRLM